VRVGVVLSGGGARCFAHIGALRALLEHGFEPAAMSTCSASAIVGALHAAGHSPKRIEEIFRDASFLKLLDINFDGGDGMIGFAGLEAMLKPHLPETFEELAYPFAAVAVDVQQGRLYTLRNGPLVRRICASNAFPGLFDPVEDSGRFLIDGGTLNIVPVDVIRTLTDEPVVTIDVTLPIDRKLDLSETASAEGFWNKLASRLNPKHLTLPLELAEKAFTITQGKLAELTYAMYPPDLVIKPPLPDDIMPHHFNKMDEAIRCGYEGTLRALEADGLPPSLTQAGAAPEGRAVTIPRP
jgi:NTE family protein